nr:hypothetical protein [Mycobacterium leprae]
MNFTELQSHLSIARLAWVFWTRDVGGEYGTLHADVVDSGMHASYLNTHPVATLAVVERFFAHTVANRK